MSNAVSKDLGKEGISREILLGTAGRAYPPGITLNLCVCGIFEDILKDFFSLCLAE